MSRDTLLYVADIVAAGKAILRYINGVTLEAFAANDEKRAVVEERQVFVIGEAAARLPDEWKQRRPEVPWRKIVGLLRRGCSFSGVQNGRRWRKRLAKSHEPPRRCRGADRKFDRDGTRNHIFE